MNKERRGHLEMLIIGALEAELNNMNALTGYQLAISNRSCRESNGDRHLYPSLGDRTIQENGSQRQTRSVLKLHT